MQLHIIQMLHFCMCLKCKFESSLFLSCFCFSFKEKCYFPAKQPTGTKMEMQPNKIHANLDNSTGILRLFTIPPDDIFLAVYLSTDICGLIFSVI